jgi:CheY-like chemotaxis protein
MNTDQLQKVILLADDDMDDAEIFAHILTDIDPSIRFIHVKNGAELMLHLRKPEYPSPQIIFLDLNMPEMNGWQSLTELKNDPKTKNIPVVIYSTSSQQRDIENALMSGATAFITKPSDYQILKKILFAIASGIHHDLPSTLRAIGRHSGVHL